MYIDFDRVGGFHIENISTTFAAVTTDSVIRERLVRLHPEVLSFFIALNIRRYHTTDPPE